MKQRDPFDMRMPLFFKVWFAFVFFLIVCIGGTAGYIINQAIKAGPEGMGREVGSFIKGINDGSR